MVEIQLDNSDWQLLEKRTFTAARPMGVPFEFFISPYEDKTFTQTEDINHPKQLFVMAIPRNISEEELAYLLGECLGVSRECLGKEGEPMKLEDLWQKVISEEIEYNKLPEQQKREAYEAWEGMVGDQKSWHRFSHFFDQIELSKWYMRDKEREAKGLI